MRMKCRYSELLRGKRNLTVAAGNASGCDRVSDVEGEDGSSWGVGGEWDPELATAAWERKV